MNKLKKWAFGGAKDADFGGGGGGYYGQDYNSPGGEYDPTLPVNKVQQTYDNFAQKTLKFTFE